MAFPLYCLHFVMLLLFTHRFPEFSKEAVCENKNRKKENYQTSFFLYMGERFFKGRKGSLSGYAPKYYLCP